MKFVSFLYFFSMSWSLKEASTKNVSEKHEAPTDNISNQYVKNLTAERKGPNGRIYGGYSCSTDDYPFMVLILGKTSKGWVRLCGGSLINEFFVLTAAHCIKQKDGTYGVMASLSQKTSKNIGVIKKIVHPNFDSNFYSSDIAIIVLKEGVKENNHVSYVKLPTKESQLNDLTTPYCKTPTIMGWGIMSNQNVPDKFDLQCAEVPMLTLEECRFTLSVKQTVLTNDQICTLSTSGVDTCQGDSGGPLMCDDLQVGIVSWGIECGAPDSPGIYLRVDKHLNFIKNIMKQMKYYRALANSSPVLISASMFMWVFLFVTILNLE